MRKVVQITTDGWDATLYALCNDGTIWVYGNGIADWEQVKSIPQEHDTSIDKINKLNG